MKLKHLDDQELLLRTKRIAQTEREIVTEMLQHLREIERRRLFSDLGYPSLFEYAVKELKYSEGQASRRISAMRLMKEIPEIEEKISSGELSLCNVAQAKRFFKGISENRPVTHVEKIKILKKLENKSARDGHRELLQIEPLAALPKEQEKVLTADKSEIRFVIDEGAKRKLELVRSLLGPKGATMSFSELVTFMAELSAQALKEKKFGRKVANSAEGDVLLVKEAWKKNREKSPRTNYQNSHFTLSRENPRYISKKMAFLIWQRDKEKCTKCGSQRNLNIDHILPVAKGGISQPDNLRLLCFSCNQREGIKVFGLEKMERTG